MVKSLARALLGLPAIQSWNVVSLVEPIESDTMEKKFPKLFTGLGRLRDSYKIMVKSDAQLYALTTPRRGQLYHSYPELQRIVDLGVISKIDTPTEWCAGMVVVLKSNGNV